MSGTPIMDVTALRERIDGDWDLFVTLAELFIGRSVEDVAAIRAALEAQDLEALGRHAHKLKGSAMEFCAHPAVAAAKQLEERARGGDTENLAEVCHRVETELARLTAELNCILEKGFPS